MSGRESQDIADGYVLARAMTAVEAAMVSARSDVSRRVHDAMLGFAGA